MSVFVLSGRIGDLCDYRWCIKEFGNRDEALAHLNATPSDNRYYHDVIEGVRLKLESVTQVTQYQFARGT